MDSTSAQQAVIKFKTSAAKLPIKRKSIDPNPPCPVSIPDTIVNPDPKFLSPATTPVPIATPLTHSPHSTLPDSKPPAFKFHRIWTEPDEIRFLQGLLDSGSQNLSFPRDLNIFYTQFSSTMTQPYTKPQLSEKLRRFKKKFRVVSARLSKGLDASFLSSHDRALYDISKRLWHPDYAARSPFCGGANDNAKEADLDGFEVSLLPELKTGPDPAKVENLEFNWETSDNGQDDRVFGNVGCEETTKLSGVNVEYGKEEEMARRNGLAEVVAAKVVIDVFDESLEEVKLGVLNEGLSVNGCEKEKGKSLEFDKLWRKQRLAEFHVFARRARLVFESLLLRGDERIV